MNSVPLGLFLLSVIFLTDSILPPGQWVSLKLHNRQHPLAFALDLLSHNKDLGQLSRLHGLLLSDMSIGHVNLLLSLFSRLHSVCITQEENWKFVKGEVCGSQVNGQKHLTTRDGLGKCLNVQTGLAWKCNLHTSHPIDPC